MSSNSATTPTLPHTPSPYSPPFLPQTPPTRPLSILDLGCGTGRNTQKLLSSSLFSAHSITGIDASSGMLAVAQTRLPESVRLLQHDILTTPSPPPQVAGCTPVVISTLVLEHLPLEFFFRFISSCLPPLPERGYVVLSNMHSEMGMGAISQAGFHAEEEGGTRINIRAEAMYNHTVREIVEGASSVAELEVMGEVSEIGVEERNVERLGGVASGWGRSCWWG
ncbi:S-adenosyl-L-methionine-dependent methyltransferase [Terfezia claveryi]|nr:S-adenosyl-L-methionine-dependent methyltransferase [Terfezia claveryi]